MNIVLFSPEETAHPLPRSDPRARHILKVLRRGVGDRFDAGLVDGPRGKGTVVACDRGWLTIAFSWEIGGPVPPDPIVLLVGLPRPQTARRILREAASMGVSAMHFFATEKGESGYARSELWTSGEWRELLVAGTGQAFDTRIPEVSWGRGLAGEIASLTAANPGPGHGDLRVAMDLYEAGEHLGSVSIPANGVAVTLAIGPERGWSDSERAILRASGFVLCHLGRRVLRTETAVIASVAVIRSRLGI